MCRSFCSFLSLTLILSGATPLRALLVNCASFTRNKEDAKTWKGKRRRVFQEGGIEADCVRGCVNLVDGNCPRTLSLFGDYILRRTRSPVAPSLSSSSSLALRLSFYTALSLSKNLLSSRTSRLMSAPLGTFNSKDRVQISTAIRLARQLPLSSPFSVLCTHTHTLSLYLSLICCLANGFT